MSTLTRRINTYFAVLILTIFGAGASLIIIHVANNSAVAAALSASSVSAY